MADQTERMNRLVIPVDFEKKPSQDIPLQAFLFTRKGTLIERKEVSGNSIDFDLRNLSTNDVRIFLAPRGDVRLDSAQTMAALENFKPYEVVLNKGPKGELNILPIPDYLSKLWYLRTCRIRGKVTKLFQIGLQQKVIGICNARVHICEVDRIRWWINRIPDDIIRKIPEIIAQPEWPIPIPDPGPLDQVALNPQPLPPGPELSGITLRSNVMRSPVPNAFTQPATPLSLEGKAASGNIATKSFSIPGNVPGQIPPLPEIHIDKELKDQILSGNIGKIRQSIVDNFKVLQPIFCNIPWLWPYFYHCDEIKVVYTDINGLFDTTYLYWWDGDQPDLYFWVECLIEGIWTTVYKPSIPCNTYWDYSCGSEVTINITDTRVRWECTNVIGGDIIWVKTIGDGASIVHMPQVNTITTVQGKSFNRIGLSDVSVWSSPNAVGDYRRPFGGSLGFKVQFGSGLPSNGMYYYRWSYRKIRNADLSPVLSPVTQSLQKGQPVFKWYTYEYFDVLLHKHFGSKAFYLGPYSKSGNDDLYIIPPAYPTSAPVNAGELSPLWNQDTWTVFFDSSAFSDGLYEFFLELFDFAGNKLTAIPSQLFQVPDYNTFAPSVDAPPAYLQPSGAGVSSAFKMVARIDNNKTGANIYKIKVNGVEVATDCCGFVPYHPGDTIEIGFRAYQPENFALFSFTVQKGTCYDSSQSALTNASGMVIGDAGLYNRDSSSIYTHAFTPNQLLGLCSGGKKAAFAEYLYVSALATDGSNRLYYLDSSALGAFALDPL